MVVISGRLLNIAPVLLVVKSSPHPHKGHDLVVCVRQHGLAKLIKDRGAVKVELDKSSQEELHYLEGLPGVLTALDLRS